MLNKTIYIAVDTRKMIPLLSMMVSAIVVVAISSIVSAFTTAPQRHHYVVYPKSTTTTTTKTGHSFLCRSVTNLPATRIQAPITEVIGNSATQIDQDLLTIVPPNEGFRNTEASGGTEVSIASMNLLAPFYNSLQLPQKTTSDYERWEFLNNDRTQRVPKAIEMAKRTNADVLCLQEIEGGKLGEAGHSEGREFTLRDDIREWLAEPTTIINPDGSIGSFEGYDSFVWSPLNPNNKRGDVVGLCIVWRSNKHSLVEWEGYRRGMVCMLQEASDGSSSNNSNINAQKAKASFAIANLHLPARPSNVLGRLNTMSKTIRKLGELDKAMKKDRPKTTKNTIDGLIVVAGDFNSDQDSVAARLLSRGYTNYGNVRDRNYKAKVTKSSASTMSHPYRFIDSYDHGEEYGSGSNDPRFKNGNFRQLYAPVTVSLKGRGPGIMDHLFYSTGIQGGKAHRLRKKPIAVRRANPSQIAMNSSGSSKEALSASLLQDHLGKRSKRRKKGETRGGGGSAGMASAAHYSNNSKGAKLRVEAVLATVDNEETDSAKKRLKMIHEGLPNVEEGFPSDHLPVGALFSAIQDSSSCSSKEQSTDETTVLLDEKATSSTLDEGNETLDKFSEEDSPPCDDADNQNDEIETVSAVTNDSIQNNNRGQSSGVSASVRRRRTSSRTSFGLRRRHNQVLNGITEWLVGRGATSVVLDKPLYKNDLLARILGPEELKKNLKKKSRAPDMMCIFVGDSGAECLVVVEVAVASDTDKVRGQKASKYKDLIELLENSDKSCHLATIVVQDDGEIPDGTRSDIQFLTQLTSASAEEPEEIKIESDRLCAYLGSKVSSFRIEK